MITDQEIAAYERDGVACVRSVLGALEIEALTQAVLELASASTHDYDTAARSAARFGNAKTVEVEPGRFFNAVFLSEIDPRVRRAALDSPLAEHAARLMRSPTARFFYDQLFMKEPGTVSPTLWHHDMPFWPLQGEHLISCWIALTPVTLDTSGLEYIAGSHRWDKFYRATAAHLADATHEPCPDFNLEENRRGHRFLSWDMQPGDVLFHHPLAVHGARGNRSQTQRRIGLSVRYIGEDARWAPRDRAMKLPRDPRVEPGAYPDDDMAFPVAWRRA